MPRHSQQSSSPRLNLLLLLTLSQLLVSTTQHRTFLETHMGNSTHVNTTETYENAPRNLDDLSFAFKLFVTVCLSTLVGISVYCMFVRPEEEEDDSLELRGDENGLVLEIDDELPQQFQSESIEDIFNSLERVSVGKNETFVLPLTDAEEKLILASNQKNLISYFHQYKSISSILKEGFCPISLESIIANFIEYENRDKNVDFLNNKLNDLRNNSTAILNQEENTILTLPKLLENHPIIKPIFGKNYNKSLKKPNENIELISIEEKAAYLKMIKESLRLNEELPIKELMEEVCHILSTLYAKEISRLLKLKKPSQPILAVQGQNFQEDAKLTVLAQIFCKNDKVLFDAIKSCQQRLPNTGNGYQEKVNYHNTKLYPIVFHKYEISGSTENSLVDPSEINSYKVDHYAYVFSCKILNTLTKECRKITRLLKNKKIEEERLNPSFGSIALSQASAGFFELGSVPNNSIEDPNANAVPRGDI